MKIPSLGGMVENIKANITREALHKRFNKEAVDFLAQTLLSVQKNCLNQKNKLKLLNQFQKVIICDSTWLKLPSKLKDVFKGFGGDAPEAHCKLQLVYEYLSGQIDAVSITEGRENDSGYCDELLSKLSKGVLLLIDLGYFSYKFFHKIHSKSAYFITKLKSRSNIFDPRTLKEVNLVNLLTKIDTDRFELDILLGMHRELTVPCRLIGIRAPKKVAEKRRYLLKKKGVKRQPRKITLWLCDWILIITNVSKEVLPTDKVCDTYRLRWQIEIVFKQFKSILQIHKVGSANKYRVLCEIYGKLITAMIITKLHGSLNAELWNKEKRELSLDKFCKRVQERMFTFMSYIMISRKKAWDYFRKVIKMCLRSCIRLKQRSRITSIQRLKLPSAIKFKVIFPDRFASLS